MKQNRNDKCSCGSGKKFKKCCLLIIRKEEEERLELLRQRKIVERRRQDLLLLTKLLQDTLGNDPEIIALFNPDNEPKSDAQVCELFRNTGGL